MGMDSRVKGALCALACAAAVLTGATTAGAAVQTPKNGCTSDVGYEGSLTSPAYTPTSADVNTPPAISLQGWFEVESRNPSFRDEILIEYFDPRTPAAGFQPLDRMGPTTDPVGGADDLPFSNRGLSATPTFQPFNFALPLDTRNVAGVQVRIHFATGDGAFQGFRGAGIDNVTLQGLALTQTFEGGLGTWTADSAGPGEPFWQVLDNSQNVTVSPSVNPPLVTLPDSGALPATPFGTRFAWFGNTASGTYCGPDFANLDAPPDTTITSGPPASTANNDASFAFTASEPAAFFECQVDGAGFVPCGPPQTYTGLADGNHTFEVRATDFNGNVDTTPATYAWTIRPATLSDLDNPTLGVDVNVQEVSGTVLVGIRGAAARASGKGRASQKGITFVPLSEARQIPVGSFLDTRRGTVRLESAANARGKRQRGTFVQGLFQVRQSKKRSARGLTDLVLKGSSFRSCRARGSRDASAAGLSRRAIRRLRANARGRYRTSGRNSAATVRGTKWGVTDRCDGTLTKVQRGSVVVRDFRRKKNIIVKAGKSYLAKAPG
jgi:hypothetical protein